MLPEEVHEIAKAGAREALHELFMTLGLDTDDPIAVQKDLAFIRTWRESAEAIKRQGVIVLLGAALLGLAGLVWAQIRNP